MIKRSSSLPDFKTYCDILGYDPVSSVFWDIETTGLSGRSNMFFLFGIVCLENGSWQLKQYMAESLEEEGSLLKELENIFSHYKTIIHFNGSGFDIPFIKQRLKTYNMADFLSDKHSIDLYRTFLPLKRFLSPEGFTQQHLERLTHLIREDQLPGKTVASLFPKYALTKEKTLADLLLLHNADDMKGMLHILSLSLYLQLFTCPEEAIEGLCLSSESILGSSESDVKKVALLSFKLRLKEKLSVGFQTEISLSDGFPSIFSKKAYLSVDFSEKQTFVMDIPCPSCSMKHFFTDYKNYYYLPAEDMAIHKSVAAYMDPEYRQKADPDHCYIKKHGTFIPYFFGSPDQIPANLPEFTSGRKDKLRFLELNDSFFQNTNLQALIVFNALRYIYHVR